MHPNEIKIMLDDIGSRLNANRVILSSINVDDTTPNKFNLYVDVNIKEFNVVVSGDSATIAVIGPRNLSDQNVSQSLTLENVKSIVATNPEPGIWQIVTLSNSLSSVQTTAISDVLFKCGFSKHPPKAMTETSLSPFLGKYSD